MGARQRGEGPPYLEAKEVKSYGLRVYKDLLVIPVRNAVGELVSLQFIPPNGASPGKRLLRTAKWRAALISWAA